MTTVSVIIPTYNYAQYIRVAIDSVLNQNYPKALIQIIVFDDGSSDNTKEVLTPYIESKSIEYYFQENKGKANATFNAIRKCKGKYIFNLDADDYYLADKIQISVSIFEKDNLIVHVASPARVIYESTGNWDIENIPKDILDKSIEGNHLLNLFYTRNILFGGGSTYSARATALKSIQMRDEVDMFIDEYLILAILPQGKSYFLSEPLSVWRVHSSNYSGQPKSREELSLKVKRLISSSDCILSYLKENNYCSSIVKIYSVLDANRNFDFNASINKMKLSAKAEYAWKIFYQIRPGLRIILNYKVINKLLPYSLRSRLKSIKNKLL